MRNILKVKDWLDKKRSVESFLFDWTRRVNKQNSIKAEGLTTTIDPETGNINITYKFDPIDLREDYFISTRR